MQQAVAGPRGDSALAKYTTDLTAQARAGKLDPVLGRDGEIRQIMDILLRRRQNNPILTGEPGVGKTAVVEGLALADTKGGWLPVQRLVERAPSGPQPTRATLVKPALLTRCPACCPAHCLPPPPP